MMTGRRVALIDLVSQGQLRLVEELIAKKECDVNEKDYCGGCAVILCVYQNDIKILKVLIAAGANVDVNDPLGDSALFLAKELKHFQIAKLIEETLAQKKMIESSFQGSHDQRLFSGNFEKHSDELKQPLSTNHSTIIVAPKHTKK